MDPVKSLVSQPVSENRCLGALDRRRPEKFWRGSSLDRSSSEAQQSPNGHSPLNFLIHFPGSNDAGDRVIAMTDFFLKYLPERSDLVYGLVAPRDSYLNAYVAWWIKNQYKTQTRSPK